MPDTLIDTEAHETDTALVLRKNPAHNVLAQIETAKSSLADLANMYLGTEAAGQSEATLDAKRRDLQRFLSFYQGLYKHDRPEEWFVSVTKVRIPRQSWLLATLCDVERVSSSKPHSVINIMSDVAHAAAGDQSRLDRTSGASTFLIG
jgi:hypothetical protein